MSTNNSSSSRPATDEYKHPSEPPAQHPPPYPPAGAHHYSSPRQQHYPYNHGNYPPMAPGSRSRHHSSSYPPNYQEGPPPAHGAYHPPHAYHHHAPQPPHPRFSRDAPRESAGGKRKPSSRLRSKVPVVGAAAPPLVTPKSRSHDSGEALPPIHSNKKTSSSGAKPKSSKSKRTKAPPTKTPIKSLPPENEEDELQVEPMKQDFHFYAQDNYEETKRVCQAQIKRSRSSGKTSHKNKENELFLLSTLINARLIQNWEKAPSSVRASYLKKEEEDRKRFMGEEEIASRHCETLTARRRSPKTAHANSVRASSHGLTGELLSKESHVALPSLDDDQGFDFSSSLSDPHATKRVRL
mmetsp:Transcript_19144/g.42571  ORF Transcript_19144/g.42571 Transcript_19144/m.42571 type:complete len:353 (+) Transcript_19144:189-1247(+)